MRRSTEKEGSSESDDLLHWEAMYYVQTQRQAQTSSTVVVGLSGTCRTGFWDRPFDDPRQKREEGRGKRGEWASVSGAGNSKVVDVIRSNRRVSPVPIVSDERKASGGKEGKHHDNM